MSAETVRRRGGAHCRSGKGHHHAARGAGGRHRQGHRRLLPAAPPPGVLAFLKQVAKAYPRQPLHLVVDNDATRQHPNVQAWLATHPRVQWFGVLRMQDLSRRLLISRSGLSKLFSRSEAAGLVRRQPCPGDLRGTLATLTDAGRTAVARALPVHLRGIQHYFVDQLTDEELRNFASGFRKLRAAAGGHRDDASNGPHAAQAGARRGAASATAGE